jgi:cbb3-type cytochrome oxidase subunit 3
MPNKKTRNQKAKRRSLLSDKRGISVALTTMIITAGVIAFGIAVLYWAYGWGNVANQQYSATVANSQDAIGERLAFEYTTYSGNQLKVYLINNGMSNNVSIARVYIWDNSHQPIGTFTPSLMNISLPNTPIKSLNIGDEGYFTINAPGLSGYCSFRVVTERGRNFDGTFSAP